MLNQTVQGWEQPTEEVLRAADEAIRHLATLLSTGPWEGVEDKKRAEDLYLATRALMHMLADAGFPGMARPLLAALFDTRDEDLTPEKTRHVIPDFGPRYHDLVVAIASAAPFDFGWPANGPARYS